MKVVINSCYGGFSLSDEATEAYLQATCSNSVIIRETQTWGGAHFYVNGQFFSSRDIARNDPELVRVVEQLGSAADGECAELKVVEIPDDISWQIEEYDGVEWVAEVHRTWG